MAEKVFYYLLALTLAGGFFLIYNMIITELRSRWERRERKRLRAAYSEIKRLSIEQQKSAEMGGSDCPEALDAVT